ncbi:limbic system-associated membrane protein-like [Ptychodera flava]|uniref:limbic system-associated membrane protein-like n=1 Tax=Ptychodera flava TaxID=63121 RepID=UPI00396A80B2
MVVSPSTQVNEGQDVSIRCRATDGNPDPYLMSLIRDPTKSWPKRRQASCNVPTIAEEDPTTFKAELKDRVTLNCTADGVPTPTVTWYDPGNKEIPGNEDNRKITTVEDGSIVTSSLAVTVVDDSFYGNYSCVASNVIGESNRHERIIEAPSSTAEPLSGVNIAVLVGVIVLIIVIFVVFAVVRYYRKEKKRDKYEASKKEQSTQGRLELDKIEIDGNANEGMSVVPDEADGLATFTGEAKNNEDMNGLGDINNETDVTFAGQESTPNGETDHSTVDIDVNGQL